jgi:hypothetical protein
MGSMLSGIMGGGMMGGLFGGSAPTGDPGGEMNTAGSTPAASSGTGVLGLGGTPTGNFLQKVIGAASGQGKQTDPKTASDSQVQALRGVVKLVGSAVSGSKSRTRLNLKNQIVGTEDSDAGGEQDI